MTQDQSPKISVIVPVYNSEKYLRKCIDSILLQTFQNFELLLVNDGSKDRSSKICDEYVQKDERIRAFHKENGGPGSARNVGIEHAKGACICFVDSDDTVNENYLGDLLTTAKQGAIDLVMHGFKRINKEKKREVAFGNELVDAKDYQVLFEEKEIFEYGYPFSKLFKIQIIRNHNITFPESYRFAEDLTFFLNYLSKCKNVKFEDKFNYNYFIRANSLARSVKKTEECFNRCLDYKSVLKINYPVVYAQMFDKSNAFKNFKRGVGEAVFFYVWSLYLSKEYRKSERILLLKRLQKEDLSLMRSYRMHLGHPLYKIAFELVCRRFFVFADLLLRFLVKYHEIKKN